MLAVVAGADVLRQPFALPNELAEASMDVAELHGLGSDWPNTGAVAILSAVPSSRSYGCVP